MKAASSWLASWALHYLMPFILMAVPVVLLRDGLIEAAVGGALGAASMWLWVRPTLIDGLSRVAVGISLTFVFFDKPFPWIPDLIFSGQELSHLQNGFLYGGMGWLVVGTIIDFLRKKTEK